MTLLHCAIVDAGNSYTNLNLSREGTFLLMADRQKQLARMQKALHVKHPYALTQPYFSNIALNASLTWGGLFPAVESLSVPSRTKWLTLHVTELCLIKDVTIDELCR
jgi:hypothetical protein